LQELINLRGFNIDADGIFGAGTEDAVITLQAAEGLTPDGIVGTNTWKAIEEPDSATKSISPSKHEEQSAQVSWLLDEIPVICEEWPKLALIWAAKQLGAKESGNNCGPEIAHIVDGYAQYWGIVPAAYYPWCAMLAAQAVRQSKGLEWGASSLPFDGKFQGSGYQMELWAKKTGRWIPAGQACPPGAIFIMGRGGSGSDKSSASTARHVGLVVNTEGGKHLCIGGNESDRVKASYRNASSLLGYIKWW